MVKLTQRNFGEGKVSFIAAHYRVITFCPEQP